MSRIARFVRITGQVQGVAYRAWTRGEAEKLGLAGWVRNEDDGSVTALFAGEEQAVTRMVTDCWSGPGAAEVRNVEEREAEPPEGTGFEIRH
ncbi:acylphosphatase [Aquicoccus sp. SCR17]|nr:acylphosphatase [Carideicomes alvinocaridis]